VRTVIEAGRSTTGDGTYPDDFDKERSS
jgi:hypothetical protein